MQLNELIKSLEGTGYQDDLHQRLYATDASIYQERPQGVVFPASDTDVIKIVNFCRNNLLPIIPRGAGTSLAGQCVGTGLVVDVSRHLNQILSLDVTAKSVTVQPGIIRDELNNFLRPHGLQFAPITSTANRATIGGMVGNNSCGTNSIVYGDTRRYVRQLKGILSNGQEITVTDLTPEGLQNKLTLPGLEGNIYRAIHDLLLDPTDRTDIRRGFPKATVSRRNTGYALDALLDCQPYTDGENFSLTPLLTGSEGTLLFTTEITLSLVPLPPPTDVVVICQFASISRSMEAVTQVMRHQPYACELMDRIILNCTRGNLKYQPTLQHFQGDPAAVLLVEFRAADVNIATSLAQQLIQDLEQHRLGYAFNIVSGSATKDIWSLRSAGLGLLANIPGDEKGVACIEDTAVAIEDLAPYMADFSALMEQFNQEVVYYAHAGAGEIHLRPILNLKQERDRALLFTITNEVAKLVKKYDGSLSGEHGDGRVRAPFIPIMVGEENYARFKQIKAVFDPKNIFNPGKIVDPAPMNEDLRFSAGQETPAFETVLDFSASGGLLRLAEKCNGSGDCRKLPLSGGTMCPSYQVTRDEQHSTRGRANLLRQLLTENTSSDPFNREELKSALDLCISCKGCTSECPSNVDMSNLKAEFQHQYYKSNRVPLRTLAFARINDLNKIGSWWPWLTNFTLRNPFFSTVIKRLLDVAPPRSLPLIQPASLRKWFNSYSQPQQPGDRKVYLFCDEFTNYNDTPIGHKAIQLLNRLGYTVELINHAESGRAALSKGRLLHAKRCAETNVKAFSALISEETPLIGIEPSAILGFRDEYPKLVGDSLKIAAKKLAEYTFTIEEFLVREIHAFRVSDDAFDTTERKLLVHGHCHQKALTDFNEIFTLLSLPVGHTVELLDTGCCGMAGSFGYEKEHYEISMKIGELRLFPEIRKAPEGSIIIAAGTSCRHQLLDGTGVKAIHPVELLWTCSLAK